MNKFSKLGKDVPDTEAEITIDVEGDITKRRFVGEFTCRIPRKKEQCLIDKHRAFLNGPQPEQLDPETLRFHHMISYLRYTVDDKNCPKWWRESDLGYELYDVSVVQALYDKVLEFEVAWLKEVWGEEAVNKLLNKDAKKNEGPKEEAEGAGPAVGA